MMRQMPNSIYNADKLNCFGLEPAARLKTWAAPPAGGAIMTRFQDLSDRCLTCSFCDRKKKTKLKSETLGTDESSTV